MARVEGSLWRYMDTYSKTLLVLLILMTLLLGQFLPAQTAAAASCDAALFIADVSVPDGSVYAPNATFMKTWRLKNVGACAWTTAYKLIFSNGTQMGALLEIPLSATVAPN